MLDLIAKGGVLMAPIILASVVSVTLIIERFIFWKRQKGGSPIEVLKLVESGRVDEAARKCDEDPTPVKRVLKAGLEQRDNSAVLAMEAEALNEIREMERFLPALDTVITLAPLLGLLGTIIGMIQSFGVMSASGLGQPLAVTGGISEALIATAAGITVAVATLVPYNYFLSRVEKAANEIERYSTRLEMALLNAVDLESDAVKVPAVY